MYKLWKSEYEKSRNDFIAALQIDPKCVECNEGILRVKREVREKSQKIFIEAILAESTGDLTSAKKKYIECFKSSVPEDDYYGKCWRKYHRFVVLEQDEAAEADGKLRAPASLLKEDEYTKEALDHL